jgi:8-oxo-dGTP diphosphatase
MVTVVAKAYLVCDGKVLLLKRVITDPNRPGEWDLPGGGIEVDEPLLVGLSREIFEETGLGLSPERLYELKPPGLISNQPHVDKHVFWATCQQWAIKLQADEHSEYGWFDPRDALRLFPHPFYSVGLAYALEHRLFYGF